MPEKIAKILILVLTKRLSIYSDIDVNYWKKHIEINITMTGRINQLS